MPYLPVMTGRIVGSREISERFLWDVRQTVNELVLQNYAGQFRKMANRHGMRLSIEHYTTCPCDELAYGGYADEPMGEFWSWWFGTNKKYGFNFSCTEAASAAHVYGKKIVGAESFTACDSEQWLGHPGNIKDLGDWAFCEGINRFVFHRYAMQPWLQRPARHGDGPLGTALRTHANLVGQCRRHGTNISPAANISCGKGFSWPTSAISARKPRRSRSSARNASWPKRRSAGPEQSRLSARSDRLLVRRLLDRGLLTRMSVKDGRLVLPDGMSYRLLVLPNVETMTPKLLAKIKELIEAGATVVGSRPRNRRASAITPSAMRRSKRWPRSFGDRAKRPPN